MRNLPATPLIAALFSVLTANAQSVPAQATTQAQPQQGPAQVSTDKTLRFEVASVKLAAPAANPSANLLVHRELIATDPGRVHYVNVSLKGLIMNVCNLKDYQVVGPDWLKTVAVDIDATMRPGATKEQVRVMFQNLLVDRFKLTFHWDTKDLPTYSIVVARNGLKMKESAEIPASGSDAPPPRVQGPPKLDTDGFPIHAGPQHDGAGTFMINGRSQIRGQRSTIEDLANELSRTQLKVPVTDETGLKAKYDFILKFATPEWNGRLEDIPELGISASVYEAMEPLPDLAAALQSQLGLKLEVKKAPVEVLVVDRMEKAPTDN
jgi:uncharacterized protein (TIGR03435 family)